jgi:hypothetical protein
MNSEAVLLRDRGIQQSVEHADRKHEGWSDMAFNMLKDYTALIGIGGQITSEIVRDYAKQNLLPEPPDGRAWGAVMLRAAKAGLIKKVGWTTAQDPRVHCNPVSLWEIVSTTEIGVLDEQAA